MCQGCNPARQQGAKAYLEYVEANVEQAHRKNKISVAFMYAQHVIEDNYDDIYIERFYKIFQTLALPSASPEHWEMIDGRMRRLLDIPEEKNEPPEQIEEEQEPVYDHRGRVVGYNDTIYSDLWEAAATEDRLEKTARELENTKELLEQTRQDRNALTRDLNTVGAELAAVTAERDAAHEKTIKTLNKYAVFGHRVTMERDDARQQIQKACESRDSLLDSLRVAADAQRALKSQLEDVEAERAALKSERDPLIAERNNQPAAPVQVTETASEELEKVRRHRDHLLDQSLLSAELNAALKAERDGALAEVKMLRDLLAAGIGQQQTEAEEDVATEQR